MTERARADLLGELRVYFRSMLRLRAFEEAALRGLEAKLALGAVHPSIGQEAIAVGVASQLRADDILLSTHRGHGHALAKGASAEAMMRELFGRVEGTCQGKGGSMHIADFGVGMLGANGVVAANIVIAAGAAHAIKVLGDDRIVVCFFGEGATNRGPFLEGLNWAQVFELPILFVCENNRYAASTQTRGLTAGGGPSERARSLGLAVAEVDGNDVAAVAHITAQAVAERRGGAGPAFLHAQTYRLTGHTGADPAQYRLSAEVAEAWENEPISRCKRLLEAAGISARDLAGDGAAAKAEMDEAYARAAAAAYPDTSSAYADVQDVGSPAVEAF